MRDDTSLRYLNRLSSLLFVLGPVEDRAAGVTQFTLASEGEAIFFFFFFFFFFFGGGGGGGGVFFFFFFFLGEVSDVSRRTHVSKRRKGRKAFERAAVHRHQHHAGVHQESEPVGAKAGRRRRRSSAGSQAQAETGIGPVTAHAAYLINLGSPDDALWGRSINGLGHELTRAE